MTAVLSLLFGMATPPADLRLQIVHVAIFAIGGIAYAAIALVITWATDDRTRKLHLGEAMLAFSRYVAAKARLYDTRAKPRDTLWALVGRMPTWSRSCSHARHDLFRHPHRAPRTLDRGADRPARQLATRCCRATPTSRRCSTPSIAI